MRQILQNLGSGETLFAEVPCPAVRAGHLLIQTHASLVSLGTERMLVDFGRANWIDKARQQPDKVKRVLEKIRTDGLIPTLEAVKSKLDQPISMGYCNCGTVLEVGSGVSGFKQGDRVVSNGPHAEFVCVPMNLCAHLPVGVSFEDGCFTVLGAIALQGVRLIQPTLGESVTVIGLGLVGLLCVQLLRAHGCRVLGVDLEPAKCSLARQFGAETVDLSRGEDPIVAATNFSGNRGMDAVVITASTQSDEPVHQAAQMCRKRGRIVLVGVVGLKLSRADFYEKELTFQVSCSYGPGRYDQEYELKGHDYPLGFVRWTEQRNFEAVLQLLAERRLTVEPLVSHRFPFEQAIQAYDPAGLRSALGIVLRYSPANPAASERGKTQIILGGTTLPAVPEVVVGIIGAGNFTGQVLLPALKATGARLRAIASASGVSSTHLARKFGFEISTTQAETILADGEANTILITTRHDSHARLVSQALRAGKRVYVEKPLCLNSEQLDLIVRSYSGAGEECEASSKISERVEPFLMVGFNRRFAPQVVRLRELLGAIHGPKAFVVTINAGDVPSEHWTQDPTQGGGRIVGEACHFIDLLRYLAGSKITGFDVTTLGGAAPHATTPDNATFTLRFADGSMGTVHYLANGHRSFPKERVEVFCQGRVAQLDNFRDLVGFGWPGLKRMKLWRQDKGHRAEMAALVNAIRHGRPSPTPFEEVFEVTQVSFQIAAALAKGRS